MYCYNINMSSKTKNYIPERMRTGHGMLESESEIQTDSENKKVSMKAVRRIFQSAKTNLDIMKKRSIETGVDNRIKDEVISKMKKSITVYKSKYEQAQAELDVFKNNHESNNDELIRGADQFLKDNTLSLEEDINAVYDSVKTKRLKEYEKYYID